jgi:hypothetical protein
MQARAECHFSLHPHLVLLEYPMSNSGSLGTATAEPATMNRVSLGLEEIMDSRRERQGEWFSRQAEAGSQGWQKTGSRGCHKLE